MDYAERIDALEEYIEQAQRTVQHARVHRAAWLVKSCEREIEWAEREKTRLYDKIMKENGRYGG